MASRKHGTGEGRKETKNTAFWPLLGLLLAVSLGIVAYVAAPGTITMLDNALPNFPPAGVDPNTLRLIITAILFVVLILIAGLIVAVSMPKQKDRIIVSEKTLMKERQDMVLEKKARKVRQQQINKQGKSR